MEIKSVLKLKVNSAMEMKSHKKEKKNSEHMKGKPQYYQGGLKSPRSECRFRANESN